MNAKSSPQAILDQIAQIPHMERGKLSILRQGPNGPYYNLQCWENGTNCCRYVPREQVDLVQEALEGYQQFEQLVIEYSQQIIEKTRAEIARGSKKKKSHRKSSSRRTPKSSS